MNRRPIIVTRTGAAGEALVRSLEALGDEAVWIPAFERGPPPDAARVTAVLAKLAGYQLAVFVSPGAVEATAARLKGEWPAATAIGVVGEGTQRAILAQIPSAARARLLVPAAGAGEGSEPLWAALQPVVGDLRRVLILRADHGREWLSEQLARVGVSTETLAVYSRDVAAIPADVIARLRAWQAAGQTPALLVTSSEAVDALAGLLEPVLGSIGMRVLPALALHERIAARLRGAGFARVQVVTLDVESIRKAAFAQ